MSDLLGDCLAYESGDLIDRPEVDDTMAVIIEAARNWHTLTSDPRVQKRRWHQPITVQPKDRPDLADDLPAGEYLIVPVDALTDTTDDE